MKVEEEGPGALRPALLKAGRLTGEEGSLEAFLLSLGRLRCDVLRVMVFILRGEVGNDIHSRHLKKEELWTEVLEEFGLAQYELLEELRSIESRARPGKAAKGKSKERVRAQDDSGAEEVVSLSLNQRQKTNAVRKVLLGVVEDLKGEDCASAFLHPAEEEEEGYNAVIER